MNSLGTEMSDVSVSENCTLFDYRFRAEVKVDVKSQIKCMILYQ